LADLPVEPQNARINPRATQNLVENLKRDFLGEQIEVALYFFCPHSHLIF